MYRPGALCVSTCMQWCNWAASGPAFSQSTVLIINAIVATLNGVGSPLPSSQRASHVQSLKVAAAGGGETTPTRRKGRPPGEDSPTVSPHSMTEIDIQDSPRGHHNGVLKGEPERLGPARRTGESIAVLSCAHWWTMQADAAVALAVLFMPVWVCQPAGGVQVQAL